MLLLLVQRRHVVEINHEPVNPRPDEAPRDQLPKHPGVFALALLDDRRQEHGPAAIRHCHDGVDHLAYRLCSQRGVVIRTTGLTYACVEQTQIVVDLGDRADRGARVVRRRLLLDRNGR